MSLNEGLEVIGDYGFFDSGLEDLKLPSTVRVVGENAFRDCRDLRKVELQEGLENIMTNCFSGSRIKEIRIPASVRRIGSEAFSQCDSLGAVAFAPGSRLEKVGKRAFWRTLLKSGDVQFPAGARVSEGAFGAAE